MASIIGFLIGGLITQAINSYDSKPTQQGAAQKKKSAFCEPVVWATIGIFLATAASVGVLYLQRQTLEKTDETFRAGTRAFVISYELAVTPVFVNNDIPYWKVAPIIKNSGNSSTVDGRYYLGLLNETPTPPVQLHWNEIDPDVADVEFSSLPTKITLGPRAQIPTAYWRITG
jgi:hypothetical protein